MSHISEDVRLACIMKDQLNHAVPNAEAFVSDVDIEVVDVWLAAIRKARNSPGIYHPSSQEIKSLILSRATLLTHLVLTTNPEVIESFSRPKDPAVRLRKKPS
jgi:hypothetical protein